MASSLIDHWFRGQVYLAQAEEICARVDPDMDLDAVLLVLGLGHLHVSLVAAGAELLKVQGSEFGSRLRDEVLAETPGLREAALKSLKRDFKEGGVDGSGSEAEGGATEG